MKDLLFLCHRLPYPPQKGDKIRSYHVLRHLCRRWRVHLVTFMDDTADAVHRHALDECCASVYIHPIRPWRARGQALAGLLAGGSFSDSFYRYRAVQRRVDELLQQHAIGDVFCFSSPTAQYVDRYPRLRRYMDFVDMDSYKWRQYRETHRPPLSWLFGAEYRRLLARERQVAATFRASWFVTPEERALFLAESGAAQATCGYFRNGVDRTYFDPGLEFASPYAPGERVIVFTGAMDYHANVDAVCWFADEVFPALRERSPALTFCIVGQRPAPRVQALARRVGVQVTGRVADVRPYLRHAALAVAPMHIARGLQNKVLEALAMGRTVVCSPQALEGLAGDALLGQLQATGPDEFVACCERYLATPLPAAGAVAYVAAHYDWERNLAVLDEAMAAP